MMDEMLKTQNFMNSRSKVTVKGSRAWGSFGVRV